MCTRKTNTHTMSPSSNLKSTKTYPLSLSSFTLNCDDVDEDKFNSRLLPPGPKVSPLLDDQLAKMIVPGVVRSLVAGSMLTRLRWWERGSLKEEG